MSAQTHTTQSEQETIDLGASFARSLKGGERVALLGDLGAGKTRFVRGMAIALGHDPIRVASPTYVIAHEYSTPGAPITLMHVDAYRMNQDDDTAQLGIDELGADAILVAEWPDQCEAIVAGATHNVEIEHVDQTTRRIIIRELDSPR